MPFRHLSGNGFNYLPLQVPPLQCCPPDLLWETPREGVCHLPAESPRAHVTATLSLVEHGGVKSDIQWERRGNEMCYCACVLCTLCFPKQNKNKPNKTRGGGGGAVLPPSPKSFCPSSPSSSSQQSAPHKSQAAKTKWWGLLFLDTNPSGFDLQLYSDLFS